MFEVLQVIWEVLSREYEKDKGLKKANRPLCSPIFNITGLITEETIILLEARSKMLIFF